MRALGFLLLLSGWLIAVAAVALLSALPSQVVFVLTALATQLIGFVLVARSHLPREGRIR